MNILQEIFFWSVTLLAVSAVVFVAGGVAGAACSLPASPVGDRP